MAVGRLAGAARLMFRIKMQHHSCDFAPVSTISIRVRTAKEISHCFSVGTGAREAGYT
jgi:hypothetical protein